MQAHCHKLIESQTAVLDKEFPGILEKYPISKYISHLSNTPKYHIAKYISGDLKKLLHNISQDYSNIGLDTYHKLVLLHLIQHALEQEHKLILPETIKDYYLEYYHVILRDIETNKHYSGKYLLSNERFSYYLGICQQKMIPTGVPIVNLNCLSPLGTAYYLIKREGLIWGLKNVWPLLYTTLTMRPFFEMHINIFDRFLMKNFNLNGWCESYIKLAQILKKNKFMKGIYGASWFFDPQLKEVSPEISYIKDLADEIGAFSINSGVYKHSTITALFMNKHRQKLYDEGKYIPQNYMVFIPRHKLLKWGAKQRAQIKTEERELSFSLE